MAPPKPQPPSLPHFLPEPPAVTFVPQHLSFFNVIFNILRHTLIPFSLKTWGLEGNSGVFFFSVFWPQGSLSVKGKPWPKPQMPVSLALSGSLFRISGWASPEQLQVCSPGRVTCREAGRARPPLPPPPEESSSETWAAWSLSWGKTGPGCLGT